MIVSDFHYSKVLKSQSYEVFKEV